MALAYLEADLGALHRLAELVERFARGDLAHVGEQRQLEDRFGLSPKARQLLQWQVLGASGDERGESPLPPPTPSVRRLRAVDPEAATS